MTIFTTCVDPENGRWMAVSTEDHTMIVVAEDPNKAVGLLVRKALGELTPGQGVTIEDIHDIEVSGK